MVYNDEKEVSLIDLCLYILKKWKMMVIAAVVLAVLTAGVTYMQSSKAYKAAMNASTEEPAPIELMEEELETLQLKLETIDAYAANVSDCEYYLKNSIKVNMNANKFYKGTLEYIFTGADNAEFVKILAQCDSKVFSEGNYEKLAEALKYPTDAALLKEVVTAETVDAVKYVITVSHFDEKDCETMLAFYEEQMEAWAGKLEKVSGVIRTASDSSLMDERINIIEGKTDAHNAMTTILNNMTEKEKAYYAQLQAEENPTEEVVVSVPEPGVDLKMVVLAAFAGVFCVAALYGSIYIFDGRVHGKKEMESWLNLPIIEADKDDDTVAIMLSGIASQKETKKIYVTSKGLVGDENQKLKAMLEKEGIAVVFGSDILTDAKTLQEVSKCDSIVLVEKCFVSKESEIKEKIEKAAACGATVLAVILEK